MTSLYWNDWYAGWGWFLWFGMIFLFVSSAGNWGYTYQAHRKYAHMRVSQNNLDILKNRYARGDIKHEEYLRMKAEIMPAVFA